MKVIYKYPLSRHEQITSLLLPVGSQILSAQPQGDNWCLWALVETDNALTGYTVIVYGTGQEIIGSHKLRHLSTIQQGRFVWHAFEVLP